MPLKTILFALLLIALGVGTFALGEAEHRSKTALIPAFFGVAFLALGAGSMAMESMRKHLMHAAAALALLCVLFPGVKAIITLVKASFDFSKVNGLAVGAQLVMAAMSAVFLFLCILSFRAARKARQAAAT